jgi:hypothetical protein
MRVTRESVVHPVDAGLRPRASIRQWVLSDDVDFSFDFQDLLLKPVRK